MKQYCFDVCTAWGIGDPHYRAVTGRRFDFHGDGEFLLLEIGPERSQLQGILSRLRRSRRGVAVHRSFAFGEPGRFAYQVSLVLRNNKKRYDHINFAPKFLYVIATGRCGQKVRFTGMAYFK